ALYYFDYFPFWAGFFDSLGIEVVTSPPTNRQILEQGLKKASDETCLPLKLLAGHIQALKDVDGIFLPRMVSVEENTYNCPKILGIPESVLPAVPPEIPVLSVVLNWRNGQRQVLKDLQAFGLQLGKNKTEIRKAFTVGQTWQKRYQASRGIEWDFEKNLREIVNAANPLTAQKYSDPPRTVIDQDTDRLRISLVGHSYLTLEPYANLNILRRLREKADVELTENVNQTEVDTHLRDLRKKLFWSHSKQIYGSGNKFVTDPQIDGVIYLSCFGCGTDSMVQEMLARLARQHHKPYMVVTLDEHSGEAGLVTRLEAFLDMVERRKAHEGDISPYGGRLDCDSNAL
ncbi:MAG: acyl-CoA dehydratase activase-related protein, partial [Bacillota bacterium]|nr:acyl-CoA dehydratase activase-related protein [Bacillota bacterium]